MTEAMEVILGVIAGAVLAVVITRSFIVSAPAGLVRRNIRGLPVPAVLGFPFVLVSLVGVGVIVAVHHGSAYVHFGLSVAVVLIVMCAAGAWDDRRGEELPRGFSGHLAAASGFRVTGGIVKMTAGAVGGLGAGLLVATGWDVVSTALVIALAANLVNLLDRAPGRACKGAALAAIPLLAAGPTAWAVTAAPAIGAAVGVAPFDLREKAMLGDAGANPLGAVLGLGLATTVGATARWVAVILLLALNIASERWSFSSAIDATPVLRALDRWGRKG